MTPLLEATVSLPPRLQQTQVTIKSACRIAVIGPNGSGKTTLLRALAGIEGEVGKLLVSGEVLAKVPAARRVRLLSFLPASRDVHWPIPVRDVIALGLASPDAERVEELVNGLRLTALADRPIDSLSTGERARALLGRALAAKPRLLLLDEPLSNLDPAWVLRTLDLMDDVASEGTGVIAALHDLTQLGRFDRVWMLHRGKLVADATPVELLASSRFAEVFGVEPDGASWTLSPSADRQSSP